MARDQVFITTKFFPNRSDPVRELEGSLKRLGVDQVDLYLVHWPKGGAPRAWPGMERAKERGLTRSIGVSNYSARQLDEVIGSGTVPPVIDQVQFSAVSHPSRAARGGQEARFTLSDEDMVALNGLDETGGTHEANEGTWW